MQRVHVDTELMTIVFEMKRVSLRRAISTVQPVAKLDTNPKDD